jgi:hypothetical protein
VDVKALDVGVREKKNRLRFEAQAVAYFRLSLVRWSAEPQTV